MSDGPERGLDARPGRDQDLVAAGVAERVVEDLEVVEVDEQHRERPPSRPLAALEGLVDAVPEQDPVREPGQPVVQRLVADLVVEAGVLEGHRGLAREHRRELDGAGVERAAPLGGQLDQSRPSVPAATSGTIVIVRWPIERR